MNVGEMVRVTESPFFAVEEGDIGILIEMAPGPDFPYVVEFPHLPGTWIFNDDEIEAAE